MYRAPITPPVFRLDPGPLMFMPRMSHVAWALGEIGSGGGDGAATPRLVNALGDTEPLVRATAAWALGEIEDRSALPSLTRLLREDDNPDVRKAAAWALGNLK